MAQAIREEEAFGLAGWVGQSRGMALAHRHLDLEINYVLAGTMTYLVGGGIVELPPRRICLLWGGVPHQMIHRPGAVEAIWVTIPLTIVMGWRLPDSLIRPLLTAGFIADSAPRLDDLALLRQWLHDLPARGNRNSVPDKSGAAVNSNLLNRDSTDSDTALGIVLLEIQARLRRFALGISRLSVAEAEMRGDTTSFPDSGLSSIALMADFIAKNFRESIGVAEIAAVAQLHPNYAMTLFRRHTGMTLAQYLTLQRVACAQRRLATSQDAISVIALDSGFGSLSRFYEAFQQQTGNSPRRFRIQTATK